MSKNMIWIIGGCGALLVVCCLLTVVVFVVAGNQIQDTIAGLTNQTQGFSPQGGDTTLPVQLPTAAPAGGPAPTTAPGGGPVPTKAPSASTSGNPFLDALTKAKGATKYRVDFSMAFGGTQNGTYKETPFVAFSGEIDGTNSHIISNGGFLSSMMTGSETGKIEITEFGGTEYMKGASSFMGVIKLDPNTWYISTSPTANSFTDFAKPDEFSSWTGSTNAGDFSKTRSESLDGQNCDVYLYDMKSVKNAALLGLLGSAQDKSGFDAIDRADVNLWVCGDGYVHKYILDYEGHNSKTVTDKAALKMNWHVWDVNSPTISVKAPTGAKPMPTTP
jgi:hypothetical protein